MRKYKWKYPVIDILRIGISAAPGCLLIICMYTIVSAFVPALQILYVAEFIDYVIRLAGGTQGLADTFFSAAMAASMIAFQWIGGTLLRLVWIRFENRLRTTFAADIIEKRAKLEYEYIENKETWDLLKRVSDQPEVKVREFFETMIQFLCLLFKIAGIVIVLTTYIWWEGILLVIISVPLIWLSLKSGKATYEAKQEVTECDRRCEYLTDVVLGRDAAQERALFGFGEFIDRKWEEQYDLSADMTLKAYRTWYTKLEMGSIFTAITLAIAIIALLLPAVTGIITVGMFMSLTNSCISLIESMSWDFREYIDKLTELFHYIKEVKNVALLRERTDAIKEKYTQMFFDSIEFEDVSFSYPNSEKKVLDHISFKMEAGIHYAIVGKNGEGKSTIIKLLSGLYSDYSGKILINGKELQEYGLADLKGIFSIVYQDFGKYAISMRDNLKLADAGISEENIRKILQKFDLENAAHKLPDGIDTPLGRIHSSGMDLSGGEWQRLALARAYANNAPVYLLDEPVAALDPISESRVYQDFQKTSDNKTTILISHRLGSVKLADQILVLNHGKIVESGSHEKLMENHQLYYEMYESQRSWYQ
ncbi:MAG TPA: ABC transporter ATP-binding protein/permease [Candidatus Eisenbergiella stercoravium]|nr:ABC transporter ATP-binding protein/permease [Candidatus Eisenbergiella stercoravium]